MGIEWSKWKKDHGRLGPAIVRRGRQDGKRVEFITAGYLNALEAENAELRRKAELATDLQRSLEVIVNGLRDGWWGRDSGEMEEGELLQAEAVLQKYDALSESEAVQ